MSINFGAVMQEKKKKSKEIIPKQSYPILDLEAVKKRFQPYLEKIEGIFKEAQELKVETDESNEKAVQIGTSAKSLSNQIEKGRVEIIADSYNYVKGVNAFAKIFTEKLAGIEGLMKQKISTYRAFQEQKRREAEIAAKKAAEDLQKKLDLQAKATGTQPVKVETPIIPKQEKITRSETGSAYDTKHWSFRIFDADIVPKEYLIGPKNGDEGNRLFVEQKALIRKAINAGSREIPGIEIFEEIRTSFRT